MFSFLLAWKYQAQNTLKTPHYVNLFQQVSLLISLGFEIPGG